MVGFAAPRVRAIRELPDMMSALEGERGHGKVDVDREVACI